MRKRLNRTRIRNDVKYIAFECMLRMSNIPRASSIAIIALAMR
jgi:hypothetical protein